MRIKDVVYCALSIFVLAVTYGVTLFLPSPGDSVLLTLDSPEPRDPVTPEAAVPVVSPTPPPPAAAAAPTSTLEADLEKLLAFRNLLQGIDSRDAALNSPLNGRIEAAVREGNWADVDALIREALRTGAPWAFDYAAALAGNNHARLSEIAMSALLRDDSPMAHETVSAIAARQLALGIPGPPSPEAIARATEGLSPRDALHVKEAMQDAARRMSNPHPSGLLNLAASTPTAFAEQLYRDAFAAASTEEKIAWFIQSASYRSGLRDDDPRMAMVWECLTNPADEALRDAAIACLFEARHMQYPGGRDATARMIYDAMAIAGPEASMATLDALQTRIEAWGQSRDPSGNVVAMQLALDVALESTDDAIRTRAEEIVRYLEEHVDRDAITEALAEDFALLPSILSTLR